MARKGENIYRRKDGRWEGRYIADRAKDGRARYRSVYAKSYSQVKQKLQEAKEMVQKEHRIQNLPEAENHFPNSSTGGSITYDRELKNLPMLNMSILLNCISIRRSGQCH